MLFEVLGKTIRVAYQPFAVLAIISLVLYSQILKKRGWIWILGSFLCFFIIWRLFVDVISSRYCCLIIVPCILLIGLLFDFLFRFFSTKKHTIIFGILCAGLCILVLSNLFNSYRNVYIFDAQNAIYDLDKKEKGSLFFIQEKNFERLSQNDDGSCRIISEFTDLINNQKLIDYSIRYQLWGKPVYFVFYYKLLNQRINLSELAKKNIIILDSFSTNKDSSSRLVILKLSSKPLKLYHSREHSANNLIDNGFIERTLDNQKSRSKTNAWIKFNASFYNSETIILPDTHFLIPTWIRPAPQEYPKVFVDSSDPIEGHNSLHIIFNSTKYPIYFFNKFTPADGFFSCAIKSIKGSSIVQFSYESFNSDGNWENTSIEKYIYLPDTKTYLIHIPVSQNECIGNKIMFRIKSENADVLIDDVSFVPSNNK